MSGTVGTVLGSRYFKTIGVIIFVSVVVSTLIDYQFKVTAKEAYPSADALAGFFGSYYAWLSAVTMLAQLFLTGKVLLGLGLTPSLLILPLALLAGSIGLLAWPGLFAATATRMAEASLRTSINQSGVQILYLPVPDSMKKKVKVFMDVTVERLGDGLAALIILFFVILLGWSEVRLLSYCSVGLIVIWVAIVLTAHKGYVDTLRRSLAYREVSLETAPIDFTDKATVDVVLGNLEGKDEPSILFALSLAERMEPQFVVARLPRGLLSHASAEVRRRALTLVASSLQPNTLAMLFELLAAENAEVRGEAINTIAKVLKEAAIPVIRPLLNSPEIQSRRAAIQLMRQSGDAESRRQALVAFRDLVTDLSPGGEINRVEASRLIGEIDDPELSGYLSKLITDDPAPTVIREAMAAAARHKNPAVIEEIIARLGSSVTNAAARDALIRYGEMAVKALRAALFDNRVAREIRLHIPRTLSKIHAQPALNALQAGLLEEDRAIRFQVILAIDEMARRFSDLRVDRDIIESALMSDALLYFRRLVIFSALFGQPEKASDHGESLLYHALNDSMKRVMERMMWLLSLIYPGKDIRNAWAGLVSNDPVSRAYGIELLDNLLTGNVKNYVFPLFNDAQPDQRLRAALNFLGHDFIDRDAAIRALFQQDDRWLKAGAIWEIGQRRLQDFRGDVIRLAGSNDALLRETANLVLEGSAFT
ncbi:MAG TPA: Npt1/Npt2 family nucleotide transporter [Candidatus Limnocylindrales bacterium]|nr:Npt1/Npt2 family nucleotide transporter [Candidatus Limnocylindrales bacterium]